MKTRYKDLNLDFDRHPLTGDVVTAINVEAIKKAVRNLVLTNLGEIPFDPDRGSSLLGSLFENFTPLTGEFLKAKIRELIDLYEPRVKIVGITIFQRDDNNALEVSVTFKIVELNKTETVAIFVERTR